MDLHPCNISSSPASTLGQVIPDQPCKPEKTPVDSKWNDPEFRNAYKREWRQRNLAKTNNYMRGYRARNGDKMREWDRNRKRPESPAYHAKYRETHRERLTVQRKKFYDDNRERLLQWKADNQPLTPERKVYIKGWRKKNPGKVQSYQHARRARKNSGPVEKESADAFVQRIRSLRSVPCYYCGKRISGRAAHIDHVKALVKGGAHALHNLCASCPRCNLKKKARQPNELHFLDQKILNL